MAIRLSPSVKTELQSMFNEMPDAQEIELKDDVNKIQITVRRISALNIGQNNISQFPEADL